MGDTLSRAGGADESGTYIEAEDGTHSAWETDGSRTVVTQENSRFYHYAWIYNNLNIDPPIDFYKTWDDDEDDDDNNDNGEEIEQGENKTETETELTDIAVDPRPDDNLRRRSRGLEDKEKEKEELHPEFDEFEENFEERDIEENFAERRVQCYQLVNPLVYDAFKTFEALGGLEGSLLWALQQKSQKKGSGKVAPYDWCLKKFSAGLECHTATLNFVTEATKFLRDLETPPEQGAVIDPNPRVAELLALSEEIEVKKRGLLNPIVKNAAHKQSTFSP